MMVSAEGGKMKILGFARRSKDITAVVQTLGDHAIKVTGPYQTPKGTIIYTFANCVVTERELLDLANAKNLEVALSELASKCMSKDGH
jgi:hypothetical protein